MDISKVKLLRWKRIQINLAISSPARVWIPFSLSFVSLFFSLFFSLAIPTAGQDNGLQVLGQIKSLGGTIRNTPQGLEIGFHLRGRETANQALPFVAQLKNLTWLNLRRTNVSNNQLIHLKNLNSLRWLHLEQTKISDAGIQHLADLPNLEYLNLYSTRVTDQSIEHLAKLPKLKKLYVWQSQMTKQGIEKLRRKRPKLQVIVGIDLNQLTSKFPSVKAKPIPTRKLAFIPIDNRGDAPGRSENGINCQVWFKNETRSQVKVYWISYGAGDLKHYFTLKPGEVRQQNSYSRNAWLITDEKETVLGYFVAKEDDASAIIPP